MKKIISMLFLLLLSGCSAKPSSMIFSPVTNNAAVRIYPGLPFSVQANDIRRTKHLLEVIDSDGKKQRVAAGNNIEHVLAQQLSEGFRQQGLAVMDSAPGKIELSIIQLETVVAQQSMSYEAALSVEFKITISHKGQTFYKTYTGHGARKGMMQYDMASMEQSLNALAVSVLTDIFNDPFVQQSIRA